MFIQSGLYISITAHEHCVRYDVFINYVGCKMYNGECRMYNIVCKKYNVGFTYQEYIGFSSEE